MSVSAASYAAITSGLGLEIYLYDRYLNPVTTNGPVTAITGATIQMCELDTQTDHSIQFEGTTRRTLAFMQRDVTVVEVREVGTGTIAWGVVYDPVQQVRDLGVTISVTMPNITHMLSWFDTGRGRYYKAPLASIVADLGQITPLWTAVETDTGAPVSTAAAIDWNITPGVTAVGSSISKNTDQFAGWNYGAWSAQAAFSGDAVLTFVATTNTKAAVIGLTSSQLSADYHNVDKALYLANNGMCQVMENGVVLSGSVPYKAGDNFTIGVLGGIAKYYQNGVLLNQLGNPVQYPLQAQISIYDGGGGLANAIFSWSVPPSQIQYVCRFEQASPLYALQTLATDLLLHTRQGRNADGSPAFRLEVGTFGADNNFWIKSADGANPEDVRERNPLVRLAHDVTLKREASKLVNTGLPLGGGNGSTQVDLGGLWKVLYDPTDPNYGKYGSVPGSIFPEYDYNYPMLALPISQYTGPVPYTGSGGEGGATFRQTHPVLPAKPKPDGTGLQFAATNDGRWDYVMQRTDSAIAHGFFSGNLTDSTYTYPTADIPTILMVQRALYVASKAKLWMAGDVNEYYTVTTDGYGYVPAAGDYVHLQWRGTSTDVQGDYAFLDVDAPQKIVKVTRVYATTGVVDTWLVNVKGFKPGQGNSVTAQQQKTVQALRLAVDAVTVTQPIGGAIREIDDQHPVPVPFVIPDTIFQTTSVSLYIDQQAARSTVTVAGAINENAGTGITGTYSAASGGSPYSGTVISTVNSGAYSGGVISTSIYGPSSTGGVLGSPRAGGYSGNNVQLPSTLSVQNSTNLTGGLASTGTTPANLRHQHGITIGITGSSTPTLGTTMHFIAQSGTNSFIEVGDVGQGSGTFGGTLYTNDWVPPSGSDSHNHFLSHGGLDSTHTHYINDYHLLTHYHDISHYHDMSHLHNIDHVHYFPHTHAMVAGIFDTPSQSATFSVYLDGTDISAYVPDANGTVGPWAASSIAIPNLLASPYAAQRCNQKGKHLIEIHCAGASGQHGLCAIQTVGLATCQISGITTTAFAL